MNNEPVAWMDKDTKSLYLDIPKKHYNDANMIPLYTHPAKEHDLGISHAIGFEDGFKAGMQRAVEMNVIKTLTDEEIVEVINEHGWRGLTGYLLTFAHAILRKAQEK